MSEDIGVPDTAAGVRALNRLLDLELLALAGAIDDSELYVDPRNGEWILGELLAHVGEFPAFFADDLARWLDDPTATVGRTMDHPVRTAAVDGVTDGSPGVAELSSTMASAFSALDATLERLTDEHLARPMDNVKYGSELPAAYFTRYVTGHKQAHIDQLRRTIVRVRELAS